MMGSSVSNNFASWGVGSKVSDFVNYFRFQNRDVSLQANKNLSGANEEVMLWYLKLDVSISHVQHLMKVSEIHKPNERVSVMDRVIVLKLTAAENCEIPLCKSCNLSQARQRKAKVVRSEAVKSNIGAIS